MAINKLKSGKKRWRVQVTGPDKRLVTKCFERKFDAEKWEREQIRKRDFPEEFEEKEEQEEMLFSKLVEEWHEHHVSKLAPGTQKRYEEISRLHFIPTFGEMVLKDIKVTDIDAWHSTMLKKPKLSTTTCNDSLGRLKGIFNWAMKRRYMLTNPAEPVSPSKDQSKGAREYEIWLADEIQDFLEASAESEYFPLYVAALNTGMRLNELVGLQWDRVDLRRSIIRVTRTWCLKSKKLKDVTKGRKSRTIPINRSLAPVLAELRLRGHKPWVFCDADGNRIESNTFTEQIFKPTCKQAGVKVIRFHDLRHTYASHFMMNGGDVFLLQQVLGHKDITTTQQYLHFAQEFLQEAAEVVEFGLSPERGDVVPLRWGKNG